MISVCTVGMAKKTILLVLATFAEEKTWNLTP